MIRRVLTRQEGVALPVAMGVLMVISMLAAALAATSIRSTGDVVKDVNVKSALAAADAGVQAANYRLNSAGLPGNLCFRQRNADGFAPTQTSGGSANCPTAVTGDLGNGNGYQYWVSPAGQHCGTVAPPLGPNDVVRCITSIGNGHGLTRRVQTTVVDRPGTVGWLPVPGVVGLEFLGFKNNTLSANGILGSNGIIDVKNNSTVAGIAFGPGGSFYSAGDESKITYTKEPETPQYAPDPYVLEPVDPGDTATDNANNTGITLSSKSTYNSTTRWLTLDGGTTTFAAGDYNFCGITGTSNASVKVTGKVRIFVDAPGPPAPDGSGCAAGPGAGEITANNNIDFNVGGDPANLQILVVGWAATLPAITDDPCANPNPASPMILFKNQFDLNGLLYAPNAVVCFMNTATTNGGVAGRRIDYKNGFTFNWDDDSDNKTTQSGGYGLADWRECRPKPSIADDPESGC